MGELRTCVGEKGCSKPVKAKGMCYLHLGRLYRGVPLSGSKEPRKIHSQCKGCGKPRYRGSPDFYHQGNVPRQKCKDCIALESKAWNEANPERVKANSRKSNFRTNLKRRFDLSVEEYEVLFAKFGHRCRICDQAESRDRRISLDHDHKTGVIRGFLCSRCNLLLGNANDSADLLEKAAQYLRSNSDLRRSLNAEVKRETNPNASVVPPMRSQAPG